MKLKNETLAQAFGFRQSDLEANRSGSMTDRQKDTLEQRFSRGYQLYLVIIVHSVILLLGMGVIAWTQRGNPAYFTESGLAFWLTLGITGATIALFSFLMIRHQRTLKQDTQPGQVTALRGAVQIEPKSAGARQLQIDGQTFKLSVPQADAFQAGQTYHLYISPRTRQILSAEKTTS